MSSGKPPNNSKMKVVPLISFFIAISLLCPLAFSFTPDEQQYLEERFGKLDNRITNQEIAVIGANKESYSNVVNGVKTQNEVFVKSISDIMNPMNVSLPVILFITFLVTLYFVILAISWSRYWVIKKRVSWKEGRGKY